MSSPYIGEIRLFAGDFAPQGWAFCDGAQLAIADNNVLFALIGTTYGGDGLNTFNLPDLRSRVPVHQGPGFILAQAGGSETVTLTISQIPSHSHVPLASSSSGTLTAPTGNVWAAGGNFPYSTSAPNAAMDPAAVAPSGGGLPHDNMAPFLAINFIISLFGVYPSQN